MSFEAVKRLLTLTVDIVIQFQNDTGHRYISEIFFEPELALKATA
jgi:type IV secretion system protein VirB11